MVKVFLLVYSITNAQTFTDVQPLKDEIARVKGGFSSPIMLVGNKCDMEEERSVTTQDAEMLAEEWGCQFHETPSLHVLVQPRVYLLIPDYTTKNGKTIQIKKENVTASMTLFGDSSMFDFGALFRALRTNPTMEDTGISYSSK